MDAGTFWGIVESFDWDQSGDDDAVIEPAVTALAAMPATEIRSFQSILATRLYELDTKAHAENIGEDAYRGEDEAFSVDQFLYARCVVVANGRDYFGQVLADPVAMPKDMEFESLLYVADQAHERSTGEALDSDPAVSCETFSNRTGWGDADA